jgi:hypothetical protein
VSAIWHYGLLFLELFHLPRELALGLQRILQLVVQGAANANIQ